METDYSQIFAEAEKTDSLMTKALLKKIQQLIAENHEIENSFNEDDEIKNKKGLENQLESINQQIKKHDDSLKNKLRERAINNPELSQLCAEEQKILSSIKLQQDNNLRYEEAINNINTQVANLNNEKLRRDNIINEFYDKKSYYEKLNRDYEEKSKNLELYGLEAEKALQKYSELEPKVKNIKMAIDNVEPAIQQIWNLLENDSFDNSVGHKK